MIENDSQPKLVTAAIILNSKEKKILLAKRNKEPNKGFWAFPGGVGAFKYFREPYKAVQKEVEIDFGCKFRGKFYCYNYDERLEPTLTLFFVGEIAGEPVLNQKQNSEIKWFELREAKQIQLAFDHNKILDKFR
jgi:ADP-ribose pyrophosphatase YjhB (NUDIX family)